ncbi:uncharacterized protein LOC118599658 [Oryzias melastigma]|uniref:uncharacterized protein LOC118599658 n=1 Tax=Oryzias melastigma TaxID=30732 RepID=UPI00168D9625|nr:uncharacterized protein LOC118599658 [Oryzias melastigma]
MSYYIFRSISHGCGWAQTFCRHAYYLRPDYKIQASAWDSEDSGSEEERLKEYQKYWQDTSSEDENEPYCSKNLRPDNKKQALGWNSEDSESEEGKVKDKGKRPLNPRFYHPKKRRPATEEEDPKKEEGEDEPQCLGETNNIQKLEEVLEEEEVQHSEPKRKKGFFWTLIRKLKKKKHLKVPEEEQSSPSIQKSKETWEKQSIDLDEYFAQCNKCSKEIQTTEEEIVEESLSEIKVKVAEAIFDVKREHATLVVMLEEFMSLQKSQTFLQLESALIDKKRKSLDGERQEILNLRKALQRDRAEFSIKEASLQEKLNTVTQSDAEPLRKLFKETAV